MANKRHKPEEIVQKLRLCVDKKCRHFMLNTEI